MARPTQKQAKEMALARMAEIAAYDDLEEAHRDRDQLMIDLLSLFAPEVADAINADEDRVALPDGESGYGYAWAVRQ